MKKWTMTREQVEGLVGQEALIRLDGENCEPTNRLGYNGACQGDELTEWSASIKVGSETLIAYYYTDNDEDALMADNDGDGSLINWTIAGYDII
jgi:hypothetical protein